MRIKKGMGPSEMVLDRVDGSFVLRCVNHGTTLADTKKALMIPARAGSDTWCDACYAREPATT